MGVARASVIALLRILMILMVAGWVSIWVLKPTDLWTRKWRQAEDHARTTLLGYYGLDFVVYTFPIIALAVIGLVYLNLKSGETRRRSSRRFDSATSTLSNPFVVNNLLGSVSALEIIAVCLFVLFLAWTFYARISSDFKHLKPIKSLELNTWQLKYLRIATRSGLLAEVCLALLLFPVLRVAPLFRIIGIQFEASVRYHIWLGTAMIFFATFHGASTLFIWGVSRHIREEILKWQRSGRVYLAGEVALVAALVMWVTSLPVIRRKRFEIFYYTHHLYIAVLLFFLFHGGDRHFYTVFPGIFLFGVDKMLRIVQSRPETCILSAKLFSGNALELTIPKHPRLKYSPTSIVFVKISGISRLQWHAFSITSSSAADQETITILAKCQGRWTNDLYQMIHRGPDLDSKKAKCPPISIEGPYGPSSLDFLRYDSLLLVAGGIGVTPFLSIIREIGSSNHGAGSRFPERIQLVYVTKKSRDICLLSSISHILWDQTARKRRPKLKLYVTDDERLETSPRAVFEDGFSQVRMVDFDPKSAKHPTHGHGTPLETAAIGLTSAILFFVFLLSLNHIFVPKETKPAMMKLKAKGLEAKQKTPSSVIDSILLASFLMSMAGSIILAVLLRWRRLKKETPAPVSPKKAGNGNLSGTSPTTTDELEEHEIHFDGRPDFRDIFSKFPAETGGSDVGVLVCGPESMKESVARVCKEISPVSGGKSRPKFTFHALNFTL